MHWKKQAALCAISVICLAALPGCSGTPALALVNEQTLPLDGVTELVISYDEEDVLFLPGEEALVIREYMTRDRERYHAKVSRGDGRLHVSEGARPLFGSGFSRMVEVYLPAGYNGALTVTGTSGTIDLSGVVLELSPLRVDSSSGLVRIGRAAAGDIHLSTTSGILELDRLCAEEIWLETTSGMVNAGTIRGRVRYTTTSGDLALTASVGSGTYQASGSGLMDVTYTRIDGDCSFYSKAGDIKLMLPTGLTFVFEAETKNGSISTNFPTTVSEGGALVQGSVRGGAGASDGVTIRTETRNGGIWVDQGAV